MSEPLPPRLPALRFAPLVAAALVALLPACRQKLPEVPPVNLDTLSGKYVELVLGIGEHDPAYVDAYYGPEEVRAKVKEEKLDLRNLAWRASDLIKGLAQVPRVPEGTPAADAELVGLRHDFLLQQARSAAARIAMLQGTKWKFDEESKALYDAVAPRHAEAEFQATLDRIRAELDAVPGVPRDGELRDRLEALRAEVTIPADKVEAVFARALEECRSRTAKHLALPAAESFTVEQVKDKPWSAYNWYQGKSKSVIQVNVDLPIFVDRAVDLACHEGYPGHHVYNLRLENELVEKRGWREFTVYPLNSPMSLIAEGSANYGIEVAFPGEEKAAFERDALYPLAGLDPKLALPYARITALVSELSFAGNEAARRYLDGEIDAAAAAKYLEQYGLFAPERAAQRVRFFDTYRSYVVNYNLGEEMVRDHVEAKVKAAATPGESAEAANERRWKLFLELISSPRLPGGLTTAG